MKEGWTYKKLGEVCSKGRNIKWDIVADTTTYKYIDLTSVDRGDLRIHNPQTISKSDAPSRAKQIVELGDIIFATTRPTLRRVSLIDEGFDGDICSTGFCVLRPQKDKITSKWIFYVLLYDGFYNYIEPLQTGASYPAVTDNIVKDYTLPVPSLSEQQRIVSRLDSAFAHIDERKANAEKQLSEARALFQKALTKAMEPKEGWEEKKMKEIVVSLTDGDHQPPPKSNDGIPFITISNIDKDANRIDFENTFFVPRSYFEGLKKDRIPHEGDVLYTVTGSFGIPVLIDFQKEFCFQRHIALIRPNQNRLSSKFLYYWILSSYATTQAEDTATGTAQRTVSLNSLRNFVITIPPLSEQQRIVSRLDSLSAHVRELEEVLQKTIAECDALKQALLRQVFE